MGLAKLECTNRLSTSLAISVDLWDEFYGTEARTVNGHRTNYARIVLPSYDQWQSKSYVCACSKDPSLSFGTVAVPKNYIHKSSVRPVFDSIHIEPFHEELSHLESVVFSLNPDLYEELEQCSQEEQLEFLSLKFGLKLNETVVNVNQLIYPSFCEVSCCSADFGIVGEGSSILLISNPNLADQLLSAGDCTELEHQSSVKVHIEPLLDSVPSYYTSPSQPKTADTDLFAFVQANVLLQLGVPSGTFVQINAGKEEMLVQLFVLFSPNDLQTNSIYVSPRVRYVFMNHEDVVIEKVNMPVNKLSVANAVTLARVGCELNTQRRYQDIITHQLAKYFEGKHRVLQVGDLIPVTFDSNYASMFSEHVTSEQHDALVWFKVDHIDSDSSDQYHIIDSLVTRLSTSKTVCHYRMPKTVCDTTRFYHLTPLFTYNEAFDYAEKFRTILETAIKCSERGIAIGTSVLIHSSSPNVGKYMLTEASCRDLGFHLIHIDCLTITANTNSSDVTNKTIGYIRAKIETILPYVSKTVILLSHLETILEDEQSIQDSTSSKMARSMNVEMVDLITEYTEKYKGVVFVGSTNDVDSIPEVVRSKMKFEVDIPVPTERQRLEMFKWYFSPYILNNDTPQFNARLSSNVSLKTVSIQSAGLTPMDIRSIVKAVKYKCYQRLKSNDLLITTEDITGVINTARDRFSDSIGAPKIPNVTWDDIGGMDVVKGEIMDTIDMPLKHPELFSSGMKKRSGILFYGPPGTGKTLLAKAIASNFSLNFFSVKGPELLNMYIGESEANVRRVFQRGRDAKPCVIFFDELDSVAPKRGNQGDSGGVMDRVVSQLLAELDGMGTDGDGVFVVGATNRPDLLDEALLRPGRFDKMLYLGISDTNEKQANIIKALSRKFTLSPDIHAMSIAEKCPFNYTGADFYALCSDALLNAMTRTAAEVDQKLSCYNSQSNQEVSLRYWFDNLATDSDLKVVVCSEDFDRALKNLIPSVSEDELRHYLNLKNRFEAT